MTRGQRFGRWLFHTLICVVKTLIDLWVAAMLWAVLRKLEAPMPYVTVVVILMLVRRNWPNGPKPLKGGVVKNVNLMRSETPMTHDEFKAKVKEGRGQ
jgi:hypothetical protein